MPWNTDRETVTFRDLQTAAYCPRKLYYRWRDAEADPDRMPSPRIRRRRSIAFRYRSLLTADDDRLAGLPLAVGPDEFRANLVGLTEREYWDSLVDPDGIAVPLVGKDCHGLAHKVLTDPARPVLVSGGSPPDNGVWEPQSVQAVAAAKALAWERKRPVDRALIEYPAHGIVRSVDLTTRRKAAYRRALRTARSIDGPPSRLSNRAKCAACEYSDTCGVSTSTLRSKLG